MAQALQPSFDGSVQEGGGALERYSPDDRRSTVKKSLGAQSVPGENDGLKQTQQYLKAKEGDHRQNWGRASALRWTVGRGTRLCSPKRLLARGFRANAPTRAARITTPEIRRTASASTRKGRPGARFLAVGRFVSSATIRDTVSAQAAAEPGRFPRTGPSPRVRGPHIYSPTGRGARVPGLRHLLKPASD